MVKTVSETLFLLCVSSEAQGLELMCVALAEGGTSWALDSSGGLWFRTGVRSSRPQGDDDHWWQVGGITVRSPKVSLPAGPTAVSLSADQHLGLCGLRPGQPVPNAAAGNAERGLSEQGASGAGGGFLVSALPVPAEPGQLQLHRGLGGLGPESAAPGQRQPRRSAVQ